MIETRKDENEPATKGFVREALDDAVDDLAQITNSAFAKMATKDDLKVIETDVGTLKDNVEGLQTGQDRIERRLDGLMDVLDENNQLLKKLPERVERLERSIFRNR